MRLILGSTMVAFLSLLAACSGDANSHGGTDAGGSRDAASIDATAADALSADAGATDAVASDAIASDAIASDAIASDAGASDAIASDAGASDAIASDAVGSDAVGTDAVGADAGAADALALDASAPDAARADATAPDASSSICAFSSTSGEWTWASGATTIQTTPGPVYGQLGVAAPNNTPGGRQVAAKWRIGASTYVFGGETEDPVTGFTTYRNDLWRFDGTSWTWIAGTPTGNDHGSYGMIGVPASTNVPPARRSAAAWADASGNLWLFGGYGDNPSGSSLADLWKFDGTVWTWIAGVQGLNDPGVYPPNANPRPAGRQQAIGWSDANGRGWLFGGVGAAVAPNDLTGRFGDLWRWDATQWTLVSGDATANSAGIWGMRGVADSMNTPGSRYAMQGAIDSNGVFYMFGGNGADQAGPANANGPLADLWRFDGNAWTWIAGSELRTHGMYGMLGMGDVSTHPGARAAGLAWVDDMSTFWLMGGFGLDSNGSYGYLNDLWHYEQGVFTWTTGSTMNMPRSQYGMMCMASAMSTPGVISNAATWTDSQGGLWIYGGYGYDSMGFNGDQDDLWRFQR